MSTINTKLDAVTYVTVVEELVANHFDGNKYNPHFGLMNSMCTFYNNCYIDGELHEKINSEMSVLDAVNILAADEEFMSEFDRATIPSSCGLDFANAYMNAMEMIQEKRSSVNRIIDMAGDILEKAIDKISPLLSEENIGMISGIANGMADNKDLAKSLVAEYIKTNRLNEIIEKSNNSNLTIME